jgi:hypothetical protein
MTRSIFDPDGGNTERTGDRFTLPDAEQNSKMPEHVTNPASAAVTGTIDFEPPPEKPAIEVRAENNGKLLIVRLSGKLHKKDYERFVPTLEKAIQEHGQLRLLVEMYDFHGWDAGALWADAKFDMTHFGDLERVAIIGETTWEKLIVNFFKPFTKATVRYFPLERAAEARTWISAA